MVRHLALASAATLTLLCSVTSADQRSASLLLQVGQTVTLPNNSTAVIGTLNQPVSDGSGVWGVSGNLQTTNLAFSIVNGAVTYAAPVGSTFSVASGVSASGGSVIDLNFSSSDRRLIRNGSVLVKSGDSVTSYTAGTLVQRPQMASNGDAYGIISSNEASPNTRRGLIKFDAGGAATQVLFTGNAFTVNGSPKVITNAGTTNIYDVSDSGQTLVVATAADVTSGASGSVQIVVKNGALYANTGTALSSSIPGETWNATIAIPVPTPFESVAINDSGDVLIAGRTSNANANTSADRVVAFNNVVRLREGELVAGTALGEPINVALNDAGEALMVWNRGTGKSVLVGDAATLTASNVEMMLSTGDTLDTNGDTLADYTVTDILHSGTGKFIDFTDFGRAYLKVSLTPIGGGSAVQSIIAIPEPASIAAIGLAGLGLLRRRRN